jgi:AAA15 family ATPase/GTPase
MILTRAVFSKYSKLYDLNVKLDTVTIIVGQNDSGKSTLLEGIFNAAVGGTSISKLKSLSKVLDADAVIRIFFEVCERDLENILSKLDLQASNNDNFLVHHQFELEWIYPRHGEQTSKVIKVHPQFRAKYNDDERLNTILKGFMWLLGKRVMLINPTLELNSELLRPKKYFIKEKEKYPLNYLFYSTRSQKKLNKILYRLLGKVKIEFSKDNNRITTKVIQTHKEQDIEFSLNEMGDGSRKTISMIMKMYVSDCEVFLLDEPDSSMHSKLVKNLINYLKSLGRQVIISTHNEIFINEFEEENLRYLFSRSPVYSRIEDSEKSIITRIFSDLDIDIGYRKSALLSSQLILLGEGKNDKKYIDWLLKISGREGELTEFRIDYVRTGGRDIPDIRSIDRINRSDLPVLLIRDRDEKQQIYYQKHLAELGDRIYIWKRREIENYFLSYNSIYKTIKERLSGKENSISLQQVKRKIKQLAETLIVKTSLLKVYSRYESIALTGNRSLISDFIKKNSHHTDDELINLFFDIFFNPLIGRLKIDKIKEEYVKEKEHLKNECNLRDVSREGIDRENTKLGFERIQNAY